MSDGSSTDSTRAPILQLRMLGVAAVGVEWARMLAEPTPRTEAACEREETDETEPSVRSELEGLKGELARLRADLAVPVEKL